MPTSSSLAAVKVGVGSPRLVRWLSVREVVKPRAPARDPFGGEAAHLDDLVGRRRFTVGTPLAHDEQPQRPMADLGGDVDIVRAAFDGVQVLGDAAPVPGQALVERGAGNVLDTFHQLDQLGAVGRTDGGEADAAVPHHDRGHAVARRRLDAGVPGHLAVVVGVDVHETGGHHRTVGVDDAPGRFGDLAYLHHPSLAHRYIGGPRRPPVPSITVPARMMRSSIVFYPAPPETGPVVGQLEMHCPIRRVMRPYQGEPPEEPDAALGCAHGPNVEASDVNPDPGAPMASGQKLPSGRSSPGPVGSVRPTPRRLQPSAHAWILRADLLARSDLRAPLRSKPPRPVRTVRRAAVPLGRRSLSVAATIASAEAGKQAGTRITFPIPTRRPALQRRSMDGSPGELVEERDDAALAQTGPALGTPVDPTASITPVSEPGATVGWLRRGGRPWWSNPAMVLLGVLAGVLYFHQLDSNAMSNTFYAAAVKSGTESWKALFFGSLDPSSAITVDKPPASLWLMAISGRVFGFSSLSMLAPVALAGASCVVVLYHLVRRWMGDVAAVLAAFALAVTPVVTAVFRSNEPDAVMTLFLVLAAWALWSALETGATSRLVLCSALLGMAFLTKELEAFVVLPAFVLVYLFFGPPKLARRLIQLVWGLLALLVASAWWVAIVELWPATSRPYIDSSGDNSELSLIFGYNGFGRLLGTSSPFRVATPTTPAGHRLSDAITNLTHFGSQPGWQRMFAPALGSQISWLIPVATLGLVAGLWARRRSPRPDRVRAGFVFWGGWAVCAIVVLSFVQGTFHTYYVVEIAPALAALAGGGVIVMWRLGRTSLRYAWLLPLGVVASALWAAHLLERAPDYGHVLPRVVESSRGERGCRTPDRPGLRPAPSSDGADGSRDRRIVRDGGGPGWSDGLFLLHGPKFPLVPATRPVGRRRPARHPASRAGSTTRP